MQARHPFRFGLTGLVSTVALSVVSHAADGISTWKTSKTINLIGLKVSLSEPVLVARDRGFLWFPTLIPLANGDILAVMSDYADEHTKTSTSKVSWSRDGGLTWSEPKRALYPDNNVRLPNGDQLLLPYYMKPLPGGGMGAPYQICPKGTQEIKLIKEGVAVTGWPKPDKTFAPELGLAGFVFNGQSVELKDGGYLATLYGTFKDAKRYSLVAAESKDGVKWTIRSVIADDQCKLTGGEGPCESAICRLKDGRVMCVFRLASNVPYGQCFSSDDGKTWTEPAAMKDVFSVQPSLAVMKDGMVVLSGGRPGLYAWFNLDGSGKDWQKVSLVENHNECHPKDPITNSAAGGNTSSYTEVIALDEKKLLYIYDRLPKGWHAIHKDSKETNSVWVVQITVEKAKK